ncbi:diacylglycerol kinase family protein [Carboxylicivirga linearis]|uniref:Diacylglycerol kinase family protein n=1 Tax=Carboxylicivirga linearis TaxID=1628157 RepID=A0ABS5K1G6_9BACT|nr:diacylglycerol kinase family protein [Carboxylicivirga linearis]MBS2100963.1 diacylglycerol kinase family protein [Carboxylicivirga linearis]
MYDEKEHFSIKRRMKSFAFAFNGIKDLVLKEHNARIHVLALICTVILGILLKLELIEWILITIVSGGVFISELFNTAIEQIADFIEPNINPRIGLIKDYSAGAVLISSIVSVIVGCLVFIPRIIYLINSSFF